MPIFKTFKLLVAGAAVAASALPAAAQDRDVVTDGPDIQDVARTPLEILNIDADELPDVLVEALVNPYASDHLSGCADINIEITRLTRVLGPDFDTLQARSDGLTPERVAQGALGMLIPFDGIIREITGAADRQRDLRLAILAGSTRRGYLKGLGAQQGCMIPARPMSTAPATVEDTADAASSDVEPAGEE